MEERRRFPRTEINEPAYVSSGGSVMRCTVLNISAEGCAIEVDEPAFVPPRFRLVMANDSSIVRECQIAWIQQNRIGLTFVDVPQGADAKPRVADHAAAKPVTARREVPPQRFSIGLMIASSSSNDIAPFSRWPLRKKVGVESTFSS